MFHLVTCIGNNKYLPFVQSKQFNQQMETKVTKVTRIYFHNFIWIPTILHSFPLFSRLYIKPKLNTQLQLPSNSVNKLVPLLVACIRMERLSQNTQHTYHDTDFSLKWKYFQLHECVLASVCAAQCELASWQRLSHCSITSLCVWCECTISLQNYRQNWSFSKVTTCTIQHLCSWSWSSEQAWDKKEHDLKKERTGTR